MPLSISGFRLTGGASFQTLPPPPVEVGDPFMGGYYIGLYSLTGNNVPTHFLILADKAYETSYTTWSPEGYVSTTHATNNYDGWYNTNLLNDANSPICQSVRNLNIGGYTDWYIPSIYEMWTILEPIKYIFANDNTSGINPYKFPKQTTNWNDASLVTTYRSPWGDGNTQRMNGGYNYYWTSTEASSTQQKSVNSIYMTVFNDTKDVSTNAVRPIRRVEYSAIMPSRGTHVGPYRYWRWRITAIKSGSYLYIDEFAFQYNQLDVNMVAAVMTVPGGFTSGYSIHPTALCNQGTQYEYFDLYFPSNGYTDIRFDFGEQLSFSGYRWRTPTNSTGDPKSWTIQGSNDGTNWTVVHTVNNYTSTSGRNVWQTVWNF